MDFSNWLKMNEGRWRGATGGAFGNDPQEKARREREKQRQQLQPISPTPKPMGHTPNPETRQAPATQRHDNRFQGINQRVTYGKGIEKQIFDNLVACGMKLREPSSSEDMYDKIDGWWDRGGNEEPIQIKYRDTGDDILFEVMKDYHRNIPGRDMIGKAVYYAVLARTGGQIVIIEVAEAKQRIQDAMQAAEQEGFDQRGNYRTRDGIMLRVRQDPQSGQEKLMAYIPVSILKNVRPPCKANVTF
jgi:hypothetical protein